MYQGTGDSMENKVYAILPLWILIGGYVLKKYL